MALRPILRYPNPRLRLLATPVTLFDDTLRTLVADMYETMYVGQGIGLAATQINVQQRVVTMDLSENHDQPITLINPVILEKSGSQVCQEGCLSIPGVYAEVERAQDIRISCCDESGVSREFSASGLLAVCIQHELDHLDGKVFIDYLSALKRERLLEKTAKHAREVM